MMFNTKLFNKLIEKQIADGEIIDIDISIYQKDDMEVCDGGDASSKTTGYGHSDIQSLVQNKHRGSKRTSPVDKPDLRSNLKERKSYKCQHCDFISQYENVFNEHISKAHAGQPICPFCFIGFQSFALLRKHCESSHKELRNDNNQQRHPEPRKRPCRFFKNGQGDCRPRSGVCLFDHSVIPDNEREGCFHKESCTFEPHCIFFHPEGQVDDGWKQDRRNPAKLCHYTENGRTCMRSVCSFFHPPRVSSSVFHWEQTMKPPLRNMEEIAPVRIPVIVRNRMTNNKFKIWTRV